VTWEAIGTIAEIVGVIAVIATLVYLAIQVKDNTRVARSATRQAIAETTMSIGRDLVENKELAEIFLKDLREQDLDPVDQLRLYSRSYVGMRNWENIHYQYLSGMLSDDEWRGFRKNLKAIFEWKSAGTYWENESQYYSETFQKEILNIRKELADRSPELSHGYVVKGQDESH